MNSMENRTMTNDIFKHLRIAEYVKSQEQNGSHDLSTVNDFLHSLVGLYSEDSNGTPIVERIQRDWELFFSDVVAEEVLHPILEQYGFTKETKVEYNSVLEAPVETWNLLKTELKEKKRFTSDTAILKSQGWESYLENTRYFDGKSLYRARIHYKKDQVYSKEEMGARELGDCPPGRANPEGIPFLYLCEDRLTTVYEVRASLHDTVSIGEFRLTGSGPLSLLDLSGVDLDEIDLLDTDLVELAKKRLLIDAIRSDMSKPMRREDSMVEYVPTQFICEFIQNTFDVDGICFTSSVHSNGSNVVLFIPELMHCVNVEQYRISSLELQLVRL